VLSLREWLVLEVVVAENCGDRDLTSLRAKTNLLHISLGFLTL
jgi:hypothetical protein